MRNHEISRASSANIVDVQSSPGMITESKKQKLNSGLTKYNRSANKLKASEPIGKIKEFKVK